MTASLATPSWTPAAGAAPVSGWRFGREVWVDAASGRRPALQWVLKRNCSITPRQLGAVYLSLCLLALAISAGFWWQGARVVTAFASVELLCVGIALLVYARHAGDGEVLTLAGRSLAVEHNHGGQVAHADFQAEWLAVEPVAGQGSLIELSSRGQSMRVGRFLRPEVRAAFAQELRRALRRSSSPEHDTGFELK
jgi:uncharacterized membrane protein